MLARLEAKMDGLGDRLGRLQEDVAGIKARDGAVQDQLPRMERLVGETAVQLAGLVASVTSLARSVEALETRVNQGEGQIAGLSALRSEVSGLRDTDIRLSKDVTDLGKEVDGLKNITRKWTGGLAVVAVVGGLVWGALSVKMSLGEQETSPTQVVYLPAPSPSAPPSMPKRR